MKKIILFILFVFTYCSFAGQLHLGPGQQYLNIEPAMSAGAIKAGDTVFFHKGSFSGYQGISKLKGNRDNWIVFMPYRSDSIDISGCWQFMSCEYLVFKKLNFRGNTKYPGRLFSVDNSGSCETQSKFIKVDSCIFSNATDAAAVAAFKFGGVDSFEVTNCIFRDMSGLSTMDYNVCRNGIIRGNRFENLLTGGHIKGGASNIVMERNIFINASKSPWVAFELGGDTGAQFYCPEDKFEVKNLKFYSNIIVGGYRGLALSSAVECKVINNTFYNCGQATMRFLTTSNLYPALSGNIIENNIFAFGSSAYFNGGAQPSSAASFSNNIYYSIISTAFNGPYWDSPELDPIKDTKPTNFGSSIQLFRDAGKIDFYPSDNSPAIGKGKTVSEPVSDFYGNPFSNSARSIGAVEINQPNSVFISENSDDLIFSPNPASDNIEIYQPSESLKLSEGLQIRIYNVFGELVYTTPAQVHLTPNPFPYRRGEISFSYYSLLNTQYPIKLDISGLPAGVYFVRVGEKVGKFVKCNY